MSLLQHRVRLAFKDRYGQEPAVIVRAPGRVNLIGEHTDYNDGFVLPMAIDNTLWIALRPRSDRLVIPYSLDFKQGIAFSLDQLQNENNGWAEYVRGVAWALQQAGYPLKGWEGVITSDIPIGAGLSSSAALELAVARAFSTVSQFEWDPMKMAQIAQKAENLWIGVNSGIMDQMISASGRAAHALLIDCRTLQTTPAPLPEKTTVIVMDTTTRRGLIDSAYNERRRQCEQAAEQLGIATLRDISFSQFTSVSMQLEDLLRRRARHVISENERTVNASKAAQNNDPDEFGSLMNESHASLRDDFEVSSAELDTMTAIAQQQRGCYGARMTGAGFGGCVVALTDTDHIGDFMNAVSKQYHTKTGLQPELYVCQPAEGASEITQEGFV